MKNGHTKTASTAHHDSDPGLPCLPRELSRVLHTRGTIGPAETYRASGRRLVVYSSSCTHLTQHEAGAWLRHVGTRTKAVGRGLGCGLLGAAASCGTCAAACSISCCPSRHKHADKPATQDRASRPPCRPRAATLGNGRKRKGAQAAPFTCARSPSVVHGRPARTHVHRRTCLVPTSVSWRELKMDLRGPEMGAGSACFLLLLGMEGEGRYPQASPRHPWRVMRAHPPFSRVLLSRALLPLPQPPASRGLRL